MGCVIGWSDLALQWTFVAGMVTMGVCVAISSLLSR